MDHPQRPIFALGVRIAGAASFATMALLIKLAGTSGVSLPEIMFWRQFLTVPLVLVYLAIRGELGRLKTDKPRTHALRSVVGMIGMVCNFTAVLLLPLAESTTLGFTTPLFVVIIVALVLREFVGPWRWTAVVFGFAGVVIIAQPGHGQIPLFGGMIALASALLTAMVSFLIRDMGRTEEPVTIVFYFSLFGSALIFVLQPFYMTAHSPWQWLLLLAIGATGLGGQLGVTASLRHGAVASVVVMDYTSLIWATLYGWLVWDHLPPATTWLGAPLIILAGTVIAWREHRLARNLTQLAALDAN
ncbi:MAG: DMT family transporter [Novosphingobium sp.]